MSQVTSHSNAEPWQHLEPTHSATSSASGDKDTFNLIESSCRIIVLQSYSVSFSSLQRLSFEKHAMLTIPPLSIRHPPSVNCTARITLPSGPRRADHVGVHGVAPRRGGGFRPSPVARTARTAPPGDSRTVAQGATGDTTRDIVVFIYIYIYIYIYNIHTYYRRCIHIIVASPYLIHNMQFICRDCTSSYSYPNGLLYDPLKHHKNRLKECTGRGLNMMFKTTQKGTYSKPCITYPDIHK